MTDLELQDTVARIKRAQAETDKFVDEAHKLRAEAGKFQRDRQLQPWQVFATLLGAGAAFFAAGAAFVKLMGG
jgi:hypothetical protein